MDNKAKKYIFWAVILLLVAGLGIAYRAGYRIGAFGVGKLGTVEITLPLSNTTVFVDMSLRITTTKDNQTLDILLTPAMHQVIVSYPVHYPWTKKFVLGSGQKIILNPIIVDQNVSGEIITQKDFQYWTLKNQVTSDKLPTKDAPKVSADGITKIWIDDNIIFAKVGDRDITQVLAPEPIIKNVSFYADRSDAVLFSAGDSVFVIEVDNDSAHIQNIFPVYKGTNPFFIETDPHYIYVIDGATLMEVVL